MRIVFLGAVSDSKKILVLSMARILSAGHGVRVFSTARYDYEEEERDTYDFCGIEIRRFADEAGLRRILETNPCDYALIDTDFALDVGNDVKLVLVIRPERSCFEETVEQARILLKRYPYTDIHLVFHDVLEYCRVSPEFLEKLYFRSIADSVNVTKTYALYFEEQNAAAVQESLYEERLFLRRFSSLWKSQLLNVLSDITGIEAKQLKGYLKRAERMR